MSYMGTKRALAPLIASNLIGLNEGPVLELFAGMSAVGRAVAPRRNVWVNDTQAFAATVCDFQFLNWPTPQHSDALTRAARIAYRYNLNILVERFRPLVEREAASLAADDWHEFAAAEADVRALSETYALAGARRRPRKHYALFTQQYGATYFGLSQCMQLDSIRYAVDQVAPAEDQDCRGARLWMLASLGGAMLRTANSTGHFAQYLTPRLENFCRVLPKRRRSLTRAYFDELRSTKPAGDARWRAANKVYKSDACKLLEDLKKSKERPAIIYADPPYTSDQYSRFYHLLETMIYYDYPKATGKGRYRTERVVSEWSLKSKVASSFERLTELSASIGCALMISYPTNGLLKDSSSAIPEMLRRHYKRVDLLRAQPYQHSTMGGSKGLQKSNVVEQLFLAQ
jgi:adenine-specific DNA-methyltransferase